MTNYLLFESRDPLESRDSLFTNSLAETLAKAGNKVVLYLVENAVFTTRFHPSFFESLIKAGVEVWVDAFSLDERSINKEKLIGEIKVQDTDAVILCLAEGYKAIWH
jgi:predicted peroxiredoxin